MPNFRPDLVVKSSNGDLIAIIEVKNLPDLSRDEATEMRHDLLDYGFPNQAPYSSRKISVFCGRNPKKSAPISLQHMSFQ